MSNMSIGIARLVRPEHCGDWHDKPLKWCVYGPATEVQKFATKRDALKYASYRRRMTERDAQSAYIALP